MAPKITSSSTRNKRSTKKPVTKGQDPQRSNRQKVSKATVSTGDNRKSGGTAKVTTDAGRTKGGAPVPPSKTTRQSRVNGRVVKGTDTRPSPSTRGTAPSGGGKNLFGGAGDKNTAIKQAGPRAPKPEFKTSRAPFSQSGATRASIGNVKGPASSAQRPTGPVRASIGNVKGPATSPKAPALPKNTPKPTSALTKAGRFLGRASAVLTGAELFQQGKSGSELDKAVQNLPGIKANQKTDIGKRASDAITSFFKPAPNPRGPNPSKSTLKGSLVNGKIQMTQVAKPKKPAAKPAAPKAATTPARSSAPSRSSAPARSTAPARTPASRPAAKPAAKPKAPASMATESSLSASDIMKGYGMRVNQTFSAESPSTPKKRQSLREQTAEIKKMIEESKKRQGK